VQEGKVSRNGWIKVMRGKEQTHEGRITSLKHFKEDVREMVAGQECGIGLDGFEAFEAGDLLETYRLEREEL
jgi:translation initiation factor IF-2